MMNFMVFEALQHQSFFVCREKAISLDRKNIIPVLNKICKRMYPSKRGNVYNNTSPNGPICSIGKNT